jgi:hypothetical protein
VCALARNDTERVAGGDDPYNRKQNDTERRREATIRTALCTHRLSALLTDTEHNHDA